MKIQRISFSCLLIMLWLFFTNTMFAQVFHFQNTTATIIKTTAQSPAHWYLEIYNDIGIDTTLRWKADISNVPAAWTITFDDENNFYNNLQTGDSADFTLYDSLQFPQKLIIGAFTNNVPATGSVFIDVYDPANPSAAVTIEYLFIITNPVGVLTTEPAPSILKIRANKISFFFKEPTPFRIISETGSVVYSGNIQNGIYDFSKLLHGAYFVYFMYDGKQYVKKFLR